MEVLTGSVDRQQLQERTQIRRPLTALPAQTLQKRQGMLLIQASMLAALEIRILQTTGFILL
jgi:hypothetical protein